LLVTGGRVNTHNHGTAVPSDEYAAAAGPVHTIYTVEEETLRHETKGPHTHVHVLAGIRTTGAVAVGVADHVGDFAIQFTITRGLNLEPARLITHMLFHNNKGPVVCVGIPPIGQDVPGGNEIVVSWVRAVNVVATVLPRIDKD
jgi:hypothetical protein